LKPMPQRRDEQTFTEIVAPVTRTGGFLIKSIFYSAPSQLIGQRLRVFTSTMTAFEAFSGRHPRRDPPGPWTQRWPSRPRHQLPPWSSQALEAANRKPCGSFDLPRQPVSPGLNTPRAWKVLQRTCQGGTPGRRMSICWFQLHISACEAETGASAGKQTRAGRVRSPRPWCCCWLQRPQHCQGMVAVAHPSLDSFDLLSWGQRMTAARSDIHTLPSIG